ncbi:MAG: hypothetical protein ACRD5M_09200 [Candidatus Acidiferrales bacterium]
MPSRRDLAREFLKQTVSHYLGSSDFNGVRLDLLLKDSGEEGRTVVMDLVRRGQLEIISGAWDNPYIKRLPLPEVAKQLEVVQNTNGLVCVYPAIKYMKRAIPRNLYRNKPFTRLLALSHPQLEPMFFELSVLRRYQSDARYSFEFWGLDGHIGILEKHYRSRETPASDKILIQTFGLASTAKRQRLVAVFLRYLHSLTVRHQQHWASHRVLGKCKVEANYFLRGVYGEWTDGISVYSALLEEFTHINKMCGLIGLPILFKQDFSDERPKGFGLLMNTTSQEYFSFANILDKLISENLNPQFFQAQGISLTVKETNERKGTLQLLEEWLKRFVHIEGNNGAAAILSPLRRVRKDRQPTAHTIIRDEFSPQYQIRKEQLIKDVYISISNIRMFFQTNPATKGYDFPTELDPNVVLPAKTGHLSLGKIRASTQEATWAGNRA